MQWLSHKAHAEPIIHKCDAAGAQFSNNGKFLLGAFVQRQVLLHVEHFCGIFFDHCCIVDGALFRHMQPCRGHVAMVRDSKAMDGESCDEQVQRTRDQPAHVDGLCVGHHTDSRQLPISSPWTCCQATTVFSRKQPLLFRCVRLRPVWCDCVSLD